VAEQHDEETPNEDEQAQAEKEEKTPEDELQAEQGLIKLMYGCV
jgi:hypothetical protein